MSPVFQPVSPDDPPIPAELLRSAFDAAKVGMVIVNEAGVILHANRMAMAMFGYPAQELVGQAVERLVPAAAGHAHVAFRENYQRDAIARPMGANGDLRAVRKDGSEFPVEIGLHPIATSDGPRVLATVVDRSERRRFEDRFRLVVENAPNAIVMVNAAGGMVLVNSHAERIFGYPSSAMLGRPVDMLVPLRVRKGHPAFRSTFFELPHARPMGAGRDLFGLRRDGSEFPVEIGLVPLDTPEGPMVLSAIVDITERKQREQQLQATLREKEVLLGEVHHRVKNTLQVVDSLLNVQSRRVSDPGLKAALMDTQTRIRSLSMIHQTLYQSGDFAFVDFAGFLQRLLPTLVESLALVPGRVQLEVDVERIDLPITLAIPCGLIINELVTNALKHGLPDGRHGSIRVSMSRPADEQVVLVVANDGLPLPPDFDVDSPATLGMQLLRLLTQQLHGTVTVTRTPTTQFSMRFPFA